METEAIETAVQIDFNTIITAISALVVVGVNIMLWLTKIVRIEQKVDHIEKRADGIERRMDQMENKLDGLISAVSFIQGVLQNKFGNTEDESSLQPAKTPPPTANDKPKKEE